MTFSAAEIADAMYRLLPDGPMWPKLPGDAPVMDGLMAGVSEEPARVLTRVRDLEDESFPDKSVELLTEWENFFGISAGGLSLAERQQAARAAMLGSGGANVQSLLDLADAYGFSAVITAGLYQILQSGFQSGSPANGVWAGYTYGYHYAPYLTHFGVVTPGVVDTPSYGIDPWGDPTTRYEKTIPGDPILTLYRDETTTVGNWATTGEVWRGVVWANVESGALELRDSGAPVANFKAGSGWQELRYTPVDAAAGNSMVLAAVGDCVFELSRSFESITSAPLESVVTASTSTPGVVEFRALGDTYVL